MRQSNKITVTRDDIIEWLRGRGHEIPDYAVISVDAQYDATATVDDNTEMEVRWTSEG